MLSTSPKSCPRNMVVVAVVLVAAVVAIATTVGVWTFSVEKQPNSSSYIVSNNIKVTPTMTPKQKLPNDQLVFGKTFTDHLVYADWDEETGWKSPEIIPYGPFSIDPAASVFHYGLECFEGMKAYSDSNGQIRLFRPDMNIKRFRRSGQRLGMAVPDEEVLMNAIQELVKVDRSWIPEGSGYSLYIRPTMISTHPTISLAPSKQVRFFTIMSPVGPYYKTGFKAVSLYADHEHVRAWPGGAGGYKIGSNYAPAIQVSEDAATKNKEFSSVLWLFGNDFQVTEAGTMNVFFFWILPSGEKELITPSLEDGTILPGVTRDSILALCREWGEFKVTEAKFTINDVIDAVKENRLIEAFGSGTAAIVSPIKSIHFKGTDYPVPLDTADPEGQAGDLTQRISKTILDIQYGIVKHPWSVIVE